jgi:peptidoglycan/xylan/chitin deacetylase (PgdA/CDA1 family)
MNFPLDKRFAFTILDDTDDSTLENVKPVYDALKAHGIRTTKTVWPVDCPEGSRIFFAADTLQRKPYLEFVHQLAADGFEVAFHGATMESSRRDRIVQALEFLKGEFGVYPTLFCNHGQNRDNLYWGYKRFQTPWLRRIVGLLRKEVASYYLGDVENTDYFWGDLCRQHIRYVRNWTFPCLNMLDANPEMPYRLESTPYVNLWFSTADAPDVGAFVRLLNQENVDRLEQAGGLCIISTHLGKGFAKDGVLDHRVQRILEALSKKSGWYVPVSEMLDYLLQTQNKGQTLGPMKMAMLETRYLVNKLWPASSM